MFEKEFREWFESNKKWLYSSDHLQAAYFAWCAGVKQQQAAQQSVHLTAPSLRENRSRPRPSVLKVARQVKHNR